MFRERRLTLLTHTTITDPGLSERGVLFEEANTDDLKGKILDLVVIEDELEFRR